MAVRPLNIKTEKEDITMKKIILRIMVLTVILLLLFSFCLRFCMDNSSSAVTTTEEFTPLIENYEGSVFSAVIGTNSTRKAGRIGSSLVLQSLDEPIEISFGQTGRDRSFGLTIYYDYKPIQFTLEDRKNYIDRLQFDIEDSQKTTMFVYLNSSEIIPDDLCHFLTFVFTPSPDEHAKDKDSITHNSALIYNYNLYFCNYDEAKIFASSKYDLHVANGYYPYETTPFVLNTDSNNSEIREEVSLPDKCYRVTAASLFEMNYIISNPGGDAKTAAIFLEVGNEHIDVNKQEYIYVELNNELKATGKLTFRIPEKAGLYDVIGFVVYDPFLDINSNLNQIPETSTRFSLEVVEQE